MALDLKALPALLSKDFKNGIIIIMVSGTVVLWIALQAERTENKKLNDDNKALLLKMVEEKDNTIREYKLTNINYETQTRAYKDLMQYQMDFARQHGISNVGDVHSDTAGKH